MDRTLRGIRRLGRLDQPGPWRRTAPLVITTWLATALIVLQAAGYYVDAVGASLVYLLLTMLVTAHHGPRVGLLVAASSCVLVNYFFMTPVFGFAMSEPQHIAAIPVYFVAVFLGAEMTRTQAPAADQAGSIPAEAAIRFEGLRIDVDARRVLVDGSEIRLTPTEFRLLEFLYEQRGRVLPPQEILVGVWGPAYEADVRVLRTYVNQLRTKLQDSAAQPRFIRTEPGFGYALLTD